MRTLRAGVIGGGAMGRNHVRVLGELPGVEPVLVVDPALPDLGVPVVADLDRLAEPDLDFAVLAAPSALHEDLGLRLAALGIPTLVEKPVATSARAARRLVKAYAEAGVAAAAGHIERFNPVVIALCRALRDEVIGEVDAVEMTRIGPFPDRDMPVGVVGDLLVHDIDLACFLLGADYARVTATTRVEPGRSCEDEVRARGSLVHPDGRRLDVAHHASRIAPERRRALTLTGADGSLVANLIDQTLLVRADGRTLAELPVTEGQPLAGELAAWCEVVRSGRPDPALATLADGLRAVTVAEAVLASAAAGEPVTLEAA